MTGASLGPRQLSRVFPFHLVLDREGKVVQTGEVLGRMFPGVVPGARVVDHFTLRRPNVSLDFESIVAQQEAIFMLETQRAGMMFKGQMVILEGGDSIAFLGSPWVTDLESLPRLDLSLSDFALHDPIADYLFLLQSKNTALSDSIKLGERLSEVKSHLQNIIGSLNDSLVVLDPKGLMSQVNRATCDLLGYKESELIGKPSLILFADRGSVAPEMMDDPTTVDNREACFRTKEGGEIPVLLTESPILDRNGRPRGRVLLARDIRERLEMEAAFKQAEFEAARAEAAREKAEELSRALNQLSATHKALVAAQSQLIQAGKMAAIGNLVSGLSHELNNPIGIILGYTQSLLKRGQLEGPARQALEAIERQAQRSAQLVRTLLDFARKEPAERSRVQPIDLLDRVAQLAGATARKREISLRTPELPRDLPEIRVCATEIESALINLVSNAIDASPAGAAVELSARRMFREGKDGVELCVSDSGSGIPDDVLPQVFDAFFTTKPVGQGTGLGLSLTRQIVFNHGGTIELETKVGEGTRVRIWLCEAEGEGAHAAA